MADENGTSSDAPLPPKLDLRKKGILSSSGGGASPKPEAEAKPAPAPAPAGTVPQPETPPAQNNLPPQ